jgi:hypothetical protein
MMKNTSLRIRIIILVFVLTFTLNACGKSVNDLKEKKDVQGLINILEDVNKKGFTRKEAAIALSELNDPTAVEPLIRYMQACTETLGGHSSNDEWQACHDAIGPISESLGRLGDTRVLEPLVEMLEDQWVHDESVRALGILNDAQAILPLIETLDHGKSQFTDMTERYILHQNVILSLAENATPETFDSLHEAVPSFRAQKDESCRKYRLAIDALYAMQDPRIEALLLSLLKTYDMDCSADIPGLLAELWNYDTEKLLSFMKFGNGYSYQESFAALYFSQTPKPDPFEVDFFSIHDYPDCTEITFTARLLAPESVFVCEIDWSNYSSYQNNQRYCNAILADPLQDNVQISILLKEYEQIQPMPNPFTEKNFFVKMENGDWAIHNTLVKITGTICNYGKSICDITKIEPVE